MWFALLFVSTLTLEWVSGIDPPIVTTKTGKLQGKSVKSLGKSVDAFLGIPYAEPPMGEMRFNRPVPKKPWEGTLQADHMTKPCTQDLTDEEHHFSWIPEGQEVSEDCLHLNLWKPSDVVDNRPILVWIHAGGYISGSSSVDTYDGALLASEGNMVVVTFNYRLGALGFLRAGIQDINGDQGLHDQQMALKWIVDNAASFRGDPNRVTLAGEGAGSTSVGLHMLCPQSQGLFQQAAFFTGSPLHPLLIDDPEVALARSNEMAKVVNCADEEKSFKNGMAAEVLTCLRQVRPLDFTNFEDPKAKGHPGVLRPTYANEFIEGDPQLLFRDKKFRPTKALFGITSLVGSLLLNIRHPTFFEAHHPSNLSLEIGLTLLSTLFSQVPRVSPHDIMKLYLGDMDGTNSTNIRTAIAHAYGDYLFTCPMKFLSDILGSVDDVYFFVFDHRYSNSHREEWMGATAFDEQQFLFGDPLRHPQNYTENEVQLGKTMVNLWSNFVETGVPGPAGQEAWPKHTLSSHGYKEIGTNLIKNADGPREEFCDFWKPYLVA